MPNGHDYRCCTRLAGAGVLTPVPTDSPLDQSVVDGVAADHGLPAVDLRTRLDAHQAVVREVPGADSLVSEWRTYHTGDPLVAPTERRSTAPAYVNTFGHLLRV